MAVDIGLTHVALPVADIDASIDFYATYADMHVVHSRKAADGGRVAWLSDGTRPFVVVLIANKHAKASLKPIAHLGVGVVSRDEVDRRTAAARVAGWSVDGPHDSGPPVGYWAIIADPDGNGLELAYGQEVALTIATDPASMRMTS